MTNESKAKLKPCPCGQVPKKLCITSGDTFRWKLITGDCCQEWWIEARINDGDPDMDKLASEAWNTARRKRDDEY